MDRRHFLSLIASGLAAGLADPELLLWTPKSMIAVPANYGNTLITPQWVFDEVWEVWAYASALGLYQRAKVGDWPLPRAMNKS